MPDAAFPAGPTLAHRSSRFGLVALILRIIANVCALIPVLFWDGCCDRFVRRQVRRDSPCGREAALAAYLGLLPAPTALMSGYIVSVVVLPMF